MALLTVRFMIRNSQIIIIFTNKFYLTTNFIVLFEFKNFVKQ